MNDVVAKTPMGSLTIPKRFANVKGVNDDLMKGVAVSFPILSIASKQWTVRWKGESRVITLSPPHEDIAAPYVDIVILKAQEDMSRVYYKSQYAGGHERPDCWSSNGIKPDSSVITPVHPVCGTCPMSAWASGATPISPKAQACAQRRRTVVLPYQDDIANEAEGGPMLLSVPPASITNQRKYGQDLKELVLPDGTKDIPYYAIVTRLSFESKDLKGQPIKFPKIKFDYLRTAEGDPIFITDEQADVVDAMRDGEAVKQIFDSKMNIDGGEVEAPVGEGSSLVKGPAPKGANPVVPKAQGIPSKPTLVEQPAARPIKRDVIDTSINEAVAKPAAPPPSARAVNTEPKVMTPAREDEEADVDAEATTPTPGITSVFDDLMAKKLVE